MKIIDVVYTKGRTGFYFDDQRAIKKGAGKDGFMYQGEAVTDGFTSVRQAGECVSVMIVLEDGQVAHGDCAAVQYSGAGGRDNLFLADEFIPVLEKNVTPRLVGRELDSFKDLAEEFDTMQIEGRNMHTALRYGVTQAILDGVSKAKKKTMAQVIKEEYDTKVEFRRIPIFTQSGDDRYDNTDKMIIKGADVIPHGLINNVEEKLGNDGAKLVEYVGWLRDRIAKYNTDKSKDIVFHIDVYGTVGLAFDNDLEKIAEFFGKLEMEAKPHKIRIEGPIDIENREKQVEILKNLKSILAKKNINVEIVADEWCNTFEDIKLFVDEEAADMVQIKTPDLGGINNIIEAILYCKRNDVGAYCGGTCNETDRSAQICTNIAIACGADQCLAKPGMGVDEGFMIVNNEMNRILALSKINR